MTTAIILAAGTAAIFAAILWTRRTVRKSDEPGMHVYRCPECNQKVRYSARRAGRDALCPRCRQRWALPATQLPLPPVQAPARGQVRRPVVGMRKAV